MSFREREREREREKTNVYNMIIDLYGLYVYVCIDQQNREIESFTLLLTDWRGPGIGFRPAHMYITKFKEGL